MFDTPFTGQKGVLGQPGDRGSPGFDGIEGKKGGTGDSGILGYAGKRLPLTPRHTLYYFKCYTEHCSRTTLQFTILSTTFLFAAGPDGQQGTPGNQGQKGFPGIPGKEGPPGFPGFPGNRGKVIRPVPSLSFSLATYCAVDRIPPSNLCKCAQVSLDWRVFTDCMDWRDKRVSPEHQVFNHLCVCLSLLEYTLP